MPPHAPRPAGYPMKFIEMRGKSLLHVIDPDLIDPAELRAAGLTDDSLVRINLQGDIELRKQDRWEIIGGLIGEWTDRVRIESGFDFA